MRISIMHPTRNRPAQAYNTMLNWLRNAYKMDVEYILSVDTDDHHDYSHFACIILRQDNKSAIEAINGAAKLASGDMLIVVSDDTDCFLGWDASLIEALEGKSDFCAKCEDGIQTTLITMPVIDRVYYERYGYVYHPDYQHLFADDELTSVALMTGKYIKLPLLFPHNHYCTGKTPKDEINERNEATWEQGHSIFDNHALNNFGIENPVMKREDIAW